MSGCHQYKKPRQDNIYSHQDAEINQLKIRISQIEESLKGNSSNQPKEESKVSINPIKSITFRMGSNDDRIRIYWEDGRKTDMPCTKEQSIWACG